MKQINLLILHRENTMKNNFLLFLILAVLYYSPRCPHSQKVLSFLRQENITLPLKDVTQDENAKEELINVGGYAVVPCLIIDGKPIYDDNAIITWISDHKSQLAKTDQ